MNVPGLTTAARAVVLAVALGLVAGCGSGSGSGSKHDSPKPVPASLKRQFSAGEATALKAIGLGGTRLKALPSSFSGTTLVGVLGPMVTATLAFNKLVTSMDWPASLHPDEAAVLTADKAWVSVAVGLESKAHVTKTQVVGALAADLTSQELATGRLRSALGLPPANLPAAGG
jgi:hypothetical protein